MLLVVLEHDRGVMAEAAREALTFGRTLASRMGVPLHAALIGGDGAALVAEAGAHGAAMVHTVVHDVLPDYGPEAWGEVDRRHGPCGWRPPPCWPAEATAATR